MLKNSKTQNVANQVNVKVNWLSEMQRNMNRNRNIRILQVKPNRKSQTFDNMINYNLNKI